MCLLVFPSQARTPATPHPAPRFRGGAIGSAGPQQPDASDQAGTR
jgi:hypothetical protein